MTRKLYWGKAIDVTFDLDICVHAAECLKALPAVFDTHRRPWVLPDAGDAFEIARAIERCPAGALKYSFTRDYLPAESGDDTRVVALADGPLWLRGSITLVTEEGETHETRLALCRCGSSARPPFCDASGPCTGWRTPPPAKQAPASAGGAQGG